MCICCRLLSDPCLQMTSLLSSTTKQAVNSIADVVDTTVSGFKNIFSDIKKAFTGSGGGFSFSINTSPGPAPGPVETPETVATTPTPAPAPTGAPESGTRPSASPKLLMASKASKTNAKPAAAAAASPAATQGGLVLPASTTLAAANATTKLLRMMADAGSEKNPDQTLSLLTAGEQLTSTAPLTPQGGVALLDLFK